MHASRTLLWLALIAATPALAQQSQNKISGDIDIQAGEQSGSLATVSGDIHIASKAQTRSAHTVSGDITVDADATVGELVTTSGEVKIAEKGKAGGAKSVSGSVTLGRNAVVDGDVTSVSGNVFADRGTRISGDVTSVSGSIGLVQTEVGGGIHFVSNDVTVGVGSHVKGGITLKKPQFSNQDRPPRVVIGPNAVVDGPLTFELPVQLYVHSSAKIGAISGATAIKFSTDTPPKG
ncbi:MAG TPA: hypothetical protein VIP30_04910 [Stenotrophomonas sp.]